jgi:hypothetical protein
MCRSNNHCPMCSQSRPLRQPTDEPHTKAVAPHSRGYTGRQRTHQQRLCHFHKAVWAIQLTHCAFCRATTAGPPTTTTTACSSQALQWCSNACDCVQQNSINNALRVSRVLSPEYACLCALCRSLLATHSGMRHAVCAWPTALKQLRGEKPDRHLSRSLLARG